MMTSAGKSWRSTMAMAAALILLIRFAWVHRGGRRCGPDCHCEDQS